jgi:Glycosyltransferase family 92
MGDELRKRMLGWAARARAKPTFDVEEREYRLAAAGLARAVLDAAAEGESVRERLEALATYMRPRHELVVPRQMARLMEWATEDEAGVAGALRPFTDSAVAPGERLVRLVEAVEPMPPPFDETFASVIGSLFNFALAPGRVPIVRIAPFERLQALLGEGPAPEAPAERYAHNLDFAARFQQVLAGAGVPARDMLDTEALIITCWLDRDFWTSNDDGRIPRKRPPDHYLTACAIYRDEAPYLAEWLEFHRLVGFERFYLYDNMSSDDHREVLAPYLEDGLVVLHEWPHFPGQFAAYDHCLATHGEESRWIGFFDIDEFVFSPTYRPVSEVLTGYEQWPGVCVNLPRFGTSGHLTRPQGLVIENYTVRLQTIVDQAVKSIVDPAATERCRSAHIFTYHRGFAVDENGYPVYNASSKSASYKLLRGNHYYSKSEEELRAKHTRPTADYAWERRALPDTEGLARLEAEHGTRDETVMRYVEPVREALARRRPRSRTL